MPMKVLSLFDGLGGARIALDRLGINCEYYASEVDKYAIQIAMKNYPDIINLGPVEEINTDEIQGPDLLIGGSPCQSLSIAGKGGGIESGESTLFWEYVRILRATKPKYFLLENVASMSKDDVKKISEVMGCNPLKIDSALFTAQTRKRLYWTNIRTGLMPDFGIILKDILECGYSERQKSYCIDANYYKGGSLSDSFKKSQSERRLMIYHKPKKIGLIKDKDSQGYGIYSEYGKSCTIRSSGRPESVFIEKLDRKGNKKTNQKKASCLGTQKENTDTDYLKINNSVRSLTVIECERLQGIDDNYTESVSKTQRYKMIGNGFNIPTVQWILSHMEK